MKTLRRDALIIFSLAFPVLMLYRIAWPPEWGRDFLTYPPYYVDFWRSVPRLPSPSSRSIRP